MIQSFDRDLLINYVVPNVGLENFADFSPTGSCILIRLSESIPARNYLGENFMPKSAYHCSLKGHYTSA